MMRNPDVSIASKDAAAAPDAGTDDIIFGKDGNDRAHLISGWSGDEPGFRWMVGGSSSFVIDAPEGDFALELDCTPVRPPEPPKFPAQRLFVEVDGQPVGHAAVHGRRIIAFAVERESCHRRVTVTLRYPDAIHPSEFGPTREDRILGVRLARARAGALPGILPRAMTSNRSITRQGDPDAQVRALTGLGTAELASRFESLGCDCEFGQFQRDCDVELIGLFRFAETYLEHLVLGFDAAFDGIDDARFVKAAVDGDWRVHQEKYAFKYHSFMSAKDHSADEVQERHRKILGHYRRIMLERVADAERMFVFKRDVPISDAEALALHLALRRHGPATLLYVVAADADHPSGYVTTTRREGLFKGYIDRFWNGNRNTLLNRSWLELCVNAHIVAETVRGAAPPPA